MKVDDMWLQTFVPINRNLKTFAPINIGGNAFDAVNLSCAAFVQYIINFAKLLSKLCKLSFLI